MTLWVMISLVPLSMACQIANKIAQNGPTPTPTRRILQLLPTHTATQASTRIRTGQTTPDISTSEPGGTILHPTTQEGLDLTSQVTITPSVETSPSPTLEPSPTATMVVNTTLQAQYASPFPLPEDVLGFSKFGSVKITFQTHLSISDIVEFYRGALGLQRLVERPDATVIQQDSFSLIFVGSRTGMLVYLNGKTREDGLVEVSVYYGF
jgi:hypothetical protein